MNICIILATNTKVNTNVYLDPHKYPDRILFRKLNNLSYSHRSKYDYGCVDRQKSYISHFVDDRSIRVIKTMFVITIMAQRTQIKDKLLLISKDVIFNVYFLCLFSEWYLIEK